MSEQQQAPGADWSALVHKNGTPSFAEAFAAEATLEASVLSGPLRGAEAIGLFFRATTRMYDSIAFTSEAKAGLTTYLEWSGTIFGGEVGGVTVVSHDEAGLIASVRLYHLPLGMVTRFASELARRLSG
jgi:hypothetical protein